MIPRLNRDCGWIRNLMHIALELLWSSWILISRRIEAYHSKALQKATTSRHRSDAEFPRHPIDRSRGRWRVSTIVFGENEHAVTWSYCMYIDGLVQDCSISSASAMEILQSCAKPSRSQSQISELIPCTLLRILEWIQMQFHVFCFLYQIASILKTQWEDKGMLLSS